MIVCFSVLLLTVMLSLANCASPNPKLSLSAKPIGATTLEAAAGVGGLSQAVVGASQQSSLAAPESSSQASVGPKKSRWKFTGFKRRPDETEREPTEQLTEEGSSQASVGSSQQSLVAIAEGPSHAKAGAKKSRWQIRPGSMGRQDATQAEPSEQRHQPPMVNPVAENSAYSHGGAADSNPPVFRPINDAAVPLETVGHSQAGGGVARTKPPTKYWKEDAFWTFILRLLLCTGEQAKAVAVWSPTDTRPFRFILDTRQRVLNLWNGAPELKPTSVAQFSYTMSSIKRRNDILVDEITNPSVAHSFNPDSTTFLRYYHSQIATRHCSMCGGSHEKRLPKDPK